MALRLITGALLAATAGAALAQAAPPPAPATPPVAGQGWTGGPRPAETRAQAIERAQTMFARLDANHDGAITQDEVAALGQRTNPAPGAEGGGRGMGGGRMLMMADANRDGRVTLDELTAAAVARFDRMDLNHDATLTPEERAQARQQRGDRPQ